MRDLARARADAVADTKRSKQRAAAPLLRHGHVWNERTESGKSLKGAWGYDYMRRPPRIGFDDPADADVPAFCA